MRHQPFKALLTILFCGSMLLAGCQPISIITQQPTAAKQTPTVEKKAQAKTITPTRTPTATPAPTLPAHLRVDPQSLKGTEILFWHPWSGDTAAKADALVRKFNQSNEWGIRVQVKPYYSAGSLFDAMSGGLEQKPVQLPQLVAAPEEQIATWAGTKDLVVPLDDYFSLRPLGLEQATIASFNPSFWQQGQVQGSQIAVPLLRTGSVLFYNRTWAKELGFQEAPKTPDEFKKQACAAAVKNNTAKVLDLYNTGGWLIDTDALTLLSWMGAFGADPLPGKTQKGYVFESQNAEDALAFLRGMQDNGCAWIGKKLMPDEYFAKRMALFFSGSLPEMYIQKQSNMLAKNGDEWTVIPYPRKDGTGFVVSSGYSLAILADPGQESGDRYKKQMAAWLFLRWLVQPENQVELAQTLPSFPVSQGAEDILKKDQDQFPWSSILPVYSLIQPAPADSAWRTVRRLMEDASVQIYQAPADQIHLILPQLDEMVKEMAP